MQTLHDPNVPEKIDSLWLNAHIATMDEAGEIRRAALAATAGQIVWIGPQAELPPAIRQSAIRCYNANGCWITPGLIDCHTHLVYGGDRIRDFVMRLNGETYETIARQGGGIRSTVRDTRNADEETLLRQSLPRLAALAAEGVTTVEIKSGYGLDLETELRMLKVVRRLAEIIPITIAATYLGAHALPPEFQGDADGYIDFICRCALPIIAEQRLAEAVDAFCERIAFSPAQTERLFTAARRYGFQLKLHADQLSDQGGGGLAARFRALSADHLEYLSADSARLMADAGTVAVLLPGAFYFLRETQLPNLPLLRKLNIPIAVATDLNPGSSPLASLLTAANMACVLFGLTVNEALRGVTLNAARALGLQRRKGSLRPGKDADFVVWNIHEPAQLVYGIGFQRPEYIIHKGEMISPSPTQPLTEELALNATS